MKSLAKFPRIVQNWTASQINSTVYKEYLKPILKKLLKKKLKSIGKT